MLSFNFQIDISKTQQQIQPMHQLVKLKLLFTLKTPEMIKTYIPHVTRLYTADANQEVTESWICIKFKPIEANYDLCAKS